MNADRLKLPTITSRMRMFLLALTLLGCTRGELRQHALHCPEQTFAHSSDPLSLGQVWITLSQNAQLDISTNSIVTTMANYVRQLQMLDPSASPERAHVIESRFRDFVGHIPVLEKNTLRLVLGRYFATSSNKQLVIDSILSITDPSPLTMVQTGQRILHVTRDMGLGDQEFAELRNAFAYFGEPNNPPCFSPELMTRLARGDVLVSDLPVFVDIYRNFIFAPRQDHLLASQGIVFAKLINALDQYYLRPEARLN